MKITFPTLLAGIATAVSVSNIEINISGCNDNEAAESMDYNLMSGKEEEYVSDTIDAFCENWWLPDEEHGKGLKCEKDGNKVRLSDKDEQSALEV